MRTSWKKCAYIGCWKSMNQVQFCVGKLQTLEFTYQQTECAVFTQTGSLFFSSNWNTMLACKKNEGYSTVCVETRKIPIVWQYNFAVLYFVYTQKISEESPDLLILKVIHMHSHCLHLHLITRLSHSVAFDCSQEAKIEDGWWKGLIMRLAVFGFLR